MKKLFIILSVISFILLALVDFCKNVLEAHFHIQLMNCEGSFSSSDYLVDAGICQTVLLVIGIACLVAFVVSIFMNHITKWIPEE